MARNREKSNDPWYAKVAFGLFLFVLVGSLSGRALLGRSAGPIRHARALS